MLALTPDYISINGKINLYQIHLQNEYRNGASVLSGIDVKNAYPNFRKENSGAAGAINFYTKKVILFSIKIIIINLCIEYTNLYHFQ